MTPSSLFVFLRVNMDYMGLMKMESPQYDRKIFTFSKKREKKSALFFHVTFASTLVRTSFETLTVAAKTAREATGIYGNALKSPIRQFEAVIDVDSSTL